MKKKFGIALGFVLTKFGLIWRLIGQMGSTMTFNENDIYFSTWGFSGSILYNQIMQYSIVNKYSIELILTEEGLKNIKKMAFNWGTPIFISSPQVYELASEFDKKKVPGRDLRKK